MYDKMRLIKMSFEGETDNDFIDIEPIFNKKGTTKNE